VRAAVLTTACVIAALLVWSNLRQAERRAAVGTHPPAVQLPADSPDVAAAPAPRGANPREASVAPEAEAVYRPAASELAREHVVAENETLADIALRYYGDAARADDLYAANRDRIRDPAQLHAGQKLTIP
jgi:nucleoid-associated protein YgaU